MALLGSLACHLRYALIIVLVVLAVILLSKWTGSNSTFTTPRISRGVRKLIREAGELNTEAEQDANTMLQLMHASRANAYINAARMLASDKDIERIARVKLDELLQSVQEKQGDVVQRVANQNPSMMPQGSWR